MHEADFICLHELIQRKEIKMFLHSGAIMHQHMHAHRNSSKITKQIKYQVRLDHKSSISHISSPQVQTATYYKHHVWA